MQDFTAQLWEEVLLWAGGSMKVKRTHGPSGASQAGFRVNTRGHRSAGMIETHFGRAWVPCKVRLWLWVQMTQHFRGGSGAPDSKHKALTASSGWHQLLKVTLLINGFTAKLYFYRYAPMQLNVALLSRWGPSSSMLYKVFVFCIVSFPVNVAYYFNS